MNYLKELLIYNLIISISIFFLSFLFFPLSHQESYCGSYLPKDESTCDKYTNTSHICCHLTGKLYGTIQQMCYPFSREDYYKMSRSVGINGFDYKLKCGQTRGAACGDGGYISIGVMIVLYVMMIIW